MIIFATTRLILRTSSQQSSTGAVTAIGTRVATSATRVGLVMGTFGAARCLVASIRDRDDFLNNMWGGLAAGSLIGVLAPVRAGGPKALAQGVYGAVGVATMGVGAYFLAATRSDIGDGATPTPPVLPVKHHPGT